MLQRAFARSNINSLSSPTSGVCAVCTCRCGQVVARNAFTPSARSQKRNTDPFTVRGYAVRSPAVRREQRQQKQKPLATQEKEIRKSEAQNAQRQFDEDLELYARHGAFRGSTQSVKKFLASFHHHVLSNRSNHLTVDSDALRAMLTESGIYDSDATVLSRLLLLERSEQTKYLGKKLLFSMSNEREPFATIFIIYQLLNSSDFEKSKLWNPEYSKPRAHLTSMAQDNYDFQATVLEGRVAFALGNEDVAIKHWTAAVDAAVAYASERREMMAVESIEQASRQNLLDNLQTPWHELVNLHSARGEHEQALWAIEIGTSVDDPISHYQRAQYAKAPGEVVGSTSTWLYHITKAAASSHPMAAHELGLYYAMSGWKYIEDEPPDALKPTAFDSFPADKNLQRSPLTLFERIRLTIGLHAPVWLTEDPKDEIFPSAIFPTSPEARMQMALRWLNVAMDLFYAPSYLATARLHLADTLWAAAQVPQEAESLDPKRYSYASRADYEAEKPIAPAVQDGDKLDPPNPFRDPERAKSLLREVLYAVQAQRELSEIWQNTSTLRGLSFARARTLVPPTELNENILSARMSSAHCAKWYRFPEVRAMYTDDVKGVLFDSAQHIDNLEQEVQGICEEQKWDIYGHDGGLLFRHGLMPVKRKLKSFR